MQYITRTIEGFSYQIAKAVYNGDGVANVTNIKEVFSSRKLGARAINSMLEENDCNIVIEIKTVKENRRMSYDFFLANSEAYEKIDNSQNKKGEVNNG